MRMDLQGRRKRGKGTRGFTLLDVTAFLMCLSVMGVTALPSIVNVSNMATITAEAATIAALRSAIEAQRCENMISGVVNPAGNFLPEDVPFDLFDSAPPYQVVGVFDADTQDGTTWRMLEDGNMWLIYCPHYNGASWGGATQGTAWFYFWGPHVDYPGEPLGLRLGFDSGHN